MGVSVFLVILGATPLYILQSNILFPSLGLIAIYFWSNYQRAYFPYWFVFILGLIQDILMGTSLGITSLTNMLFRLLIHRHNPQNDKTPFVYIWYRFTLLTSVVIAIKWGITMLLYGQLMLPLTIVLQIIITVVSYPLFHNLLWLSSNTLPEHAK
jgi:cell shape-determining protein MreD